MSAAKKCDRCGVFYEPKKKKKTYQIFYREDMLSRHDRTIDLCDACERKLERWIFADRKPKKEEEGEN